MVNECVNMDAVLPIHWNFSFNFFNLYFTMYISEKTVFRSIGGYCCSNTCIGKKTTWIQILSYSTECYTRCGSGDTFRFLSRKSDADGFGGTVLAIDRFAKQSTRLCVQTKSELDHVSGPK